VTTTGERWVTVARVGEIARGGLKVVHVDQMPVAIFHLADGYYAIKDVCTHDGGPVAEGELDGDVIECPRHGARFNVRTGAVVRLPATTPVLTLPVRVSGEEIQLDWSEWS